MCCYLEVLAFFVAESGPLSALVPDVAVFVAPACSVAVSLAVPASFDVAVPEPAVVCGSALLPVVSSAPLSVGVLPPEAPVEPVLVAEPAVVLEDSVVGAFAVSAAGVSVPSGFCAEGSAVPAVSVDGVSVDGVDFAGMLGVVRVKVVALVEGMLATSVFAIWAGAGAGGVIAVAIF